MTTGNNHLLGQAVRAALLYGGTFAAALATHTSVAQTPPTPTNDQTDTTAPITEVVVTGSRIATPSLESVSPLTAISSDDAFIPESGNLVTKSRFTATRSLNFAGIVTGGKYQIRLRGKRTTARTS